MVCICVLIEAELSKGGCIRAVEMRRGPWKELCGSPQICPAKSPAMAQPPLLAAIHLYALQIRKIRVYFIEYSHYYSLLF